MVFDEEERYRQCTSGSHPLYPVNDPKTFAAVEQWLTAEAENYNSRVAKIVAEVKFKKMGGGGEADQKVMDQLIKELVPVLDVLDKHLAKSDYIAGKHLTIADISFLPYTEYFVENAEHAKLIESRPHLNAWWKKIRALPSWQKLSKQF